MKTEQDKEQRRNYMKAYRERPYVKAKYHEYYIVNKMHWGGITKSKQQENELLHAKNTERFTNYEEG